MEDANELIERAREAGFIDTELKKHAPHAKDCLTRANAEKSHFVKEERFPLKLENIYGMLILLAIGLGGGLVTLICEVIIHELHELGNQEPKKCSERASQARFGAHTRGLFITEAVFFRKFFNR